MPDSVYDPEADEQLGRAFDRRLARRLMEAASPHRWLIAGSLLLFPVVAAVELAQPWLLKVAIDEHILKSDWIGLTWVAGLYIAVLAVLYALRTAEDYMMQLTGQRVIHDLRQTIFDHLLRLEARFFDRNPVGRLMTRVLHDVEAVSEAWGSRSMRRTLLPSRCSATPRLNAEVVLATPPFWLARAVTRAAPVRLGATVLLAWSSATMASSGMR